MKKCLFILGLLAAPLPTFAANLDNPTGKLGVGVILGEPMGLTAKYWMGRDAAWDAAVGFDDLSFHADYLLHVWDLFPQPEEGRLPAYWGLGARVTDKDRDTEAAVRLVGGVAYLFPNHPLEVFAEIVPAIELTPDVDMDLDAGIGLRIYFAGRAGAPR